MDIQALFTIMFNLFLIVDPIASIPLIPEMMAGNTKEERKKMIRRAVIVASIVLLFFALAGRALLGYFGVSIAAVRIAGGILLFGIGFEMLYGRITRTEVTKKEEAEAIEKKDVSITPLAIPLLAGPGAIATVMMFSSIYPGGIGMLMLFIALILVMLTSYVFLGASEILSAKLGQIGVKVIGRVMGLLIIFSATQIFLEGLKIAGILGA